MDLQPNGRWVRRLVIKVHKPEYGKATATRLLMVSAITDARLAEKIKSDLERDKAVLIR
jgi:two-component system, sensor histidine kinase PdtaS